MHAASDVIRVVILGSGTSHGVPMIGCDCPVCTSTNPRDQRSRPSIWVDYGDRGILVDAAPELRLQCIANNVRRVDALLFTHHHADHVAGLDDLRRFNWILKSAVPCYGLPDTLEVVRRMFLYAFEEDSSYPSYKPDLHLVPIEQGTLELFGRAIIPIPLMHGPLPVLGYRFGSIAYCTDCNFIGEESVELLRGLDVLILDALRIRPHATHFNLEQAIEAARIIGARRTLFTHIAHEIMHEPVNAGLPDGMELAYDGQIIIGRT
ncbi:MAG: MBL fold metallo-hydrolase [Phycisphaerae bacterium]|nr:MBL fold metallo-hydrolase [Phycisphaerae bacterium]